eukprot:m.8100 g.8100  ORF g.8100 m.8100 type:complete len:491 (+) comp20328_c0_seq2:81-1553(+)
MASKDQTQSSISSLFVGNLDENVTEAILFKKFNPIGPVLSIRLIRDSATQKSLSRAYVNFQHPENAKRALDELNGEEIEGREMKVQWPRSSLREKGASVYVKNLGDFPLKADAIQSTFEVFGAVVQCCVLEKSAHAIVHFEETKSAEEAVEKLNGRVINGTSLLVEKYVDARGKSGLKQSGENQQNFKNLYVKNFGSDYGDCQLETDFSAFGDIANLKVEQRFDRGNNFAYVCYQTHEAAVKALQGMNGRVANGRKLSVQRYQRKEDRHQTAKQSKRGKLDKEGTANLYVKNLDDEVDEDHLRRAFELYGPVANARVMVDEKGRSKGFGFVSLSSPSKAAKAVQEMNKSVISKKPLYVALAQTRDERRTLLANVHGPVKGTGSAKPSDKTCGWQISLETLHAAKPLDRKTMLGTRVYCLVKQLFPYLTPSAGSITDKVIKMDCLEVLDLLGDVKSFQNEVRKIVRELRAGHGGGAYSQSSNRMLKFQHVK